LPNAGDSSATVGDRKLAVFYTGIAGVKLIAHLYDAPPDGTPGDAAHLAGGLTLGVYAVGNYAADPSQSDVFKTLLKRGTMAVTGVIGINLPTTAALTFSFTPWTSDSRMGKSFVFGFNVLRPTKDAPPKPTAAAPAPPEPAGFL
jgi:hypothetical protein